MAERRPIVLLEDGSLSQLPSGDTLPSDSTGVLDARVNNLARLWFCDYLLNRVPETWTEEQVEAGLFDTVFTAVSQLPTPVNGGEPHFAMLALGNTTDLAYWDFISGGGWQVTSKPFPFPFGVSTTVQTLDLTDTSLGTGDFPWNFVVGMVFQVLGNCTMTDYAIKLGSGTGFDRRVQLIRSTSPQVDTFAAGDFTDVIFTENYNRTAGDNEWETVDRVPNVPLVEGEVYYLGLWISQGGQFQTEASLRASGSVDETFIMLRGGAFTAQAVNPGGAVLPTGVSGVNVFGMIAPVVIGITN